MVQGVGPGTGGIRSLIQLIDEHPGAVNLDLMRFGHRLRDLDDPGSGLILGDVLDMVEHADPSSAVYRATVSEPEWDLPAHLLAALFDRAQMDAWAQGGGKGPKPKPLPRPGVTDKATKKYETRKPSTIAEIDMVLSAKIRAKT